VKPFYFNTSAHLLRITTQKANTLAEFLAALRVCPDDSIFQHTFRTLQEHHFIREGFSNDFAHWALAACNEPGLAEQLASVDVREFTSLGDLRERFIQMVEKHLPLNPSEGPRMAEERFYFCASDIVVMPTNFVAETVQDFAKGLREVSVHSLVLKEVKEVAGDDPDIIILDLPPWCALEINALQRASTIVVQKSLKEGFGLTVTEALWKGKPTIAGAVGGIPNQIIDKLTGMLVHSVEGCAYQIRYILTHPEFAAQLGRNGREHVKENFLMTTNVRRWLLLLRILLRVGTPTGTPFS
jgi:glycosyltransferase involved in cell wall biosynthesis